MARLTDDDGIDGPFNRAMDRALAEDARRRQAAPVTRAAGVLQPPVEAAHLRHAGAVDEIFEATRAAVAERRAVPHFSANDFVVDPEAA